VQDLIDTDLPNTLSEQSLSKSNLLQSSSSKPALTNGVQVNHLTQPRIVLGDMSPSAITTIETTPSFTSLNSYYDEKSSYIELNGANIPKHIIGTALKEKVENIDHEACEPGDEDTFFVADLGEVYRQHMRWKLNLPRVKPFYGMFCFLFVRTKLMFTSGQM
jgi:hypothetical protein